MMIVEDGLGQVDSNSYVTQEEAQAYFTTKGIDVTITDESLINATQFIDVTYGAFFNGKKVSYEQALAFPRTKFRNTENFIVEQGTIPRDLKVAVYEAARLALTEDLFDTDSNEQDNILSKTQSVEGAVSQSITYAKPTQQNQKASIGRFLRTILTTSVTQMARVK